MRLDPKRIHAIVLTGVDRHELDRGELTLLVAEAVSHFADYLPRFVVMKAAEGEAVVGQ